MPKICIIMIVALAISVAGCQNMNQRIKSGNCMKFAVLPFENLSGDPNAGLIVMSGLESALACSSQHQLIEPDKVRTLLQPYQDQYMQPQKMAKLLKAQAVITGSVTEYRYVYGAGEQPVVSVNIRIISGRSGKVLYSHSYTSSGAYSWLKEVSLGEITKKLCSKIVSDLEVYL